MDATDFRPADSQTADRLPANCPFCGQDGAFDGQGVQKQESKITTTFETIILKKRWWQLNCPECGGTFKMLDCSEEEVEE